MASKTFVLVHGIWHGGWCWSRLAGILRARGHTVSTPTLTGLGERSHLLSRGITLTTFVTDIVNHLDWDDLRDVILVGHSFGGAVALNAGVAFGPHCAGVVTLATQSAGCETADQLMAPLLLLHGDADQLLPFMASEMVAMLAGKGELVPLHGAGHLLTEAAEELRARLSEWIPARFADHSGPDA